ncbi:inter-alpha-trypsin inhibitor heavy chain H3 isoform X2 [Thalassophryne amazonica]|uniref:inter-alpha-trypsin inhibitor heavy chain H3 isoform X2 n=1 Tax=Thalassophryne amazonica TaxID=390379 RepID=UPI001470D134|nr:inter-alpha-trypsin inhibitor heavy chain H3 isoform X2 [Thalassophryne amazonica]
MFPFQRAKHQSKPSKAVLKVTEYHVTCSVVSRYAVTTVQSSVWNQLSITKEAAFEVDLPSSAFISNFTITTDSKVYVAQVKGRAAARKIYDAAKKQGKTAGLVATKEREIEKFRVAVSVPSGTRVSFCLSYEELLPRRLGRYELTLGLRPGQPVQNLTLDVSIAEKTGISFLKILPLKTNRLLTNTAQGDSSGVPPSTHMDQSPGCARVSYTPTLQQQNSISTKGLNADFIIQYDVDLTDLIGDVQVYDGYFVHYFAPRGLPVVPKDVIFVIDVSGSMIGTKIKQTKQAMNTILGDLREGDHFNIITFSDQVHTWKKGRTVRATRQNVRDAKDFVKRIVAEGWTNINAALLSAGQLVNPPFSSSYPHVSSHRVPLVIFLTDGEATIGVTAGDTILNNAKKALGSASLFGLAFGDDADFLLLKRLALENRGVARMVYEEADAALQLKGFYDEVASPLLSDIQLSYLDDQAFDVTRSLFPNYFQGSELVVTGRVKPRVNNFKVSVSASDAKQQLKVENDVSISHSETNGDLLGCLAGTDGISSFVRRLWAYFTIKELLLAKLNTTDSAAQRLLTEKATNLSLKYNFVTPVTSLVVVKPDAEKAPQTPTTTQASVTAQRTTAAARATTATTTATTKASAAVSTKKPILPSSARPSKAKPDPPQPNTLQPRKPFSLPSTPKNAVMSSKKPTTTSSPSPIKTVPAPFSGKKLTPSQNDSKTSSAPPAGKISTSLLNSLKPASPLGPGQVLTPQPSAARTIFPSTTPFSATLLSLSTTPPLIAVRTDFEPHPGRPQTPKPSIVRAATLPESKNNTISATGIHELGIPTMPPNPLPPLTSPPQASDNKNLSNIMDPSAATLVSATFAPMPGEIEESKLWEATGLLDVSTSIQVQRKDIDLVKDYDATYDYDIDYDGWDDVDMDSFDPPPRLRTVRVFSSSVDGDPHFVVQLPKLHQNLCFTVDGRTSDVLRLLEDPKRGIIVDGHLVGAPSKHNMELRSRTYFDQLTISSTTSSSDIMITISLDAVVVEGEGLDTLPVNQQGSLMRQGVKVTMDKLRNCWINLSENMRFLILFHQYRHPNYQQMAHLGFYIVDGQGLSASTQGLLGQFQHADMSVTLVKDHPGGQAHQAKQGVLASGVLRWGPKHMAVTLQEKTLKDTANERHLDRCWVVPKAEVERLLGHPYESYVVDHV